MKRKFLLSFFFLVVFALLSLATGALESGFIFGLVVCAIVAVLFTWLGSMVRITRIDRKKEQILFHKPAR